MDSHVVKYHNDLNQVYLGKLTPAVANLTFDLIARVRDKGIEPIYFSAQELRKKLASNYTEHEFSNFIASFRKQIFKLDFTVIKEFPDGRVDEDIYNLFRRLTIHRLSANKEVTGITVQVDEIFKYLVNNIQAQFTVFELEELFQIRGGYAKTLFRLLKQFRATGQYIESWSKFRKLMAIPEKTKDPDVFNRILKPAVKELMCERTVNGVTRPTFTNLTFQKQTSQRKPTAILFLFDSDKTIAIHAKKPKAQEQNPFAQGTKDWYVWNHLPVPENLEQTAIQSLLSKSSSTQSQNIPLAQINIPVAQGVNPSTTPQFLDAQQGQISQRTQQLQNTQPQLVEQPPVWMNDVPMPDDNDPSAFQEFEFYSLGDIKVPVVNRAFTTYQETKYIDENGETDTTVSCDLDEFEVIAARANNIDPIKDGGKTTELVGMIEEIQNMINNKELDENDNEAINQFIEIYKNLKNDSEGRRLKK